MKSQTGTQTVTINILPDIKKSNQTMKFGQLINYIARNIFRKKIIQKMRQGE